jgi:putative CocE/NonD family hydrolase
MKKLGLSLLASVSFFWAQSNQPASQTIYQLMPQLNEEEKKAKDLREYIKANYTKDEFLIPMRDGVRLFTSVYTPKIESEPFPILINRTPYTVAPYGIENYRSTLGPSEKFVREGFIFVYQDVRGKGRSEGQFVHVRPHNPNKKSPKDIDESSDTYDTVDWLIKHVPNNNGKAGIYGISYPGFYAANGAIDAHPAMKASSPQAPVSEWFIGDDFRHNGALFLAHAFRFFSAFGQDVRPSEEAGSASVIPFKYGTPNGYEFYLRTGPLQNFDEKFFHGKIEYWKELIDNDTYSPYWQARNVRQYMKAIKPAMLTVGGWFDAEDLFGALRLYSSAEKQSPGAQNMIVMGPWIHGGWSRGDGDHLGPVPFNAKTAVFFRDNIEFPFFLFHLKGKGEPKLPEAYMFETGRNEWHKHEEWPPKAARPKTFYLRDGGRLASQASSDAAGFDEYVSDPNKPVPFMSDIQQNMATTYMVDDQRFASSRTDVMVYQTEPLESDLRVAGPLKVTLHVSTSGTDSDWVVKLIDVYPPDFPDTEPPPLVPGQTQTSTDRVVKMGGYQQLVRGEPFRGKFRRSFEKPEPFTPGKVEKIEFELPDIYHAFRRGHRVMVHVQSSWFPLVDRNPQKFLKISEARAEDFQKATQRIYRSGQHASSVQLPVLE